MKSVGGQRNQRKANSEMRWSGKLEGTGRETGGRGVKEKNLKKCWKEAASSETGTRMRDGGRDAR